MVAGALADLAGLWAALQRAAGATDRLFAVIDTVPEICDRAPTVALPAGRGAIELDHVSFAYPARNGRGCALRREPEDRSRARSSPWFGPSGAGKSTILSLLFRFYDVDAGRFLFEGIDVRDLPLADLRRSLAMVAQEPVLFSGTIPREHRLRPRRREPRRDRARRARCLRTRLHHRLPRRLRHRHRRARHQAIGRPEAARRPPPARSSPIRAS